MRRLKERSPADFVRAPAADEQLLGLWARIEHGEARRLTRARRLRQGVVGGAMLGVMLAVFMLMGSPSQAPVAAVSPAAAPTAAPPAAVPPPAVPPAVESVPSNAPQELALADGSHLFLSAATRARVLVMQADEVRVRLERGEVECDVARAPERRFIVEAGTFEVVVTGTRFTVAAGGEGPLASKVSVSVQRGSVEVREAPDRLLAALGPGQLWASDRQAASPLPASPLPAAPSSEPCASCAVPPAKRAASGGAPSSEPRRDPRALLARASDARRAGKPAEAAAALEELIRRYPADEGAGYAAFLLGRIQLDGLGDARSAVESFSFAVAHPGSGFFPEDAAARRVEALGKAGRAAECAQARDRFLAKYPQATRAAAMQGMCDAP